MFYFEIGAVEAHQLFHPASLAKSPDASTFEFWDLVNDK